MMLVSMASLSTCCTLLTKNFPLQIQSGSYWKSLGTKERNQLLITYNSLRNGYDILQVKIVTKDLY